jgi:ubiquinone/menaquinone biosynthesis C-methylase UbiE
MRDARSHGAAGAVLHSAARSYDLLAALLFRGRERAFRERLADLARIAPSEHVLDVGCGTGSLAIVAARRVGPAGFIHAVDPSAEMIAAARRKAQRAGVALHLEEATLQELPFPDAGFDVVLSTLMLHHLSHPARQQGVHEMRRVLNPGGRVLIVDFTTPARHRTGLIARLHRHGQVNFRDVLNLLRDAGFEVVDSGSVGVRDLDFALANTPLAAR